MTHVNLYFFIIIISSSKIPAPRCLNGVIILAKFLADFKEALFNFLFDLWFQFFLHIVHLQILTFEMLQRVLLLLRFMLVFLNGLLLVHVVKDVYLAVVLGLNVILAIIIELSILFVFPNILLELVRVIRKLLLIVESPNNFIRKALLRGIWL
mgnify:CR=1 FL=1